MFGFFKAIDLDASERRRDLEVCIAWVYHSKAAMPIFARVDLLGARLINYDTSDIMLTVTIRGDVLQ